MNLNAIEQNFEMDFFDRRKILSLLLSIADKQWELIKIARLLLLKSNNNKTVTRSKHMNSVHSTVYSRLHSR